MDIYFLGTDGVELQGSALQYLTERPKDKQYLIIEFFDDHSLTRIEQCITIEQLASLRAGEMTLVLSNTHEAFHSVVRTIYELVVIKLGIPPAQIILMSESAIIDQPIRSIAEQFDLPEIHAEWSRIFEFNLTVLLTNDVTTLEDKHYDKKFINFNRRWRPHRPVFVALLKAHGLLDKGYVSLMSGVDNDTWESTWEATSQLEPSLISHKNSILNTPPLCLDTTELNLNQVDLSNSTDSYYSNSYFSIVSETYFYDWWGIGLFLSEKTFKPIKKRHPFILLNRPHALEKLRSIGYQSFSDIIDESYDTEEDDMVRMHMVLAETKRLSSLSGTDLSDFLAKARVICDHNYNVLQDKRDFVTRL